MLTKLAKAFSLLRQEVTTLKGDVQRIEKVRPVVKHGKDGVSPDPDEIVSAVLEKIPTPKDGVSPDPHAVAEAAAKLIPEPKPGRDAVPPSVRDVADVVLAKIEKPKDGVSPDPKAIAEAAAKLLPVPKDGVSPTAEEVAKKMPNPQRGKTGARGKNGVSVTDVQLSNNELFVFLDGKKKKAGTVKVPAASTPFNPGNAGGGGSARGAAREPVSGKSTVERLITAQSLDNQQPTAVDTPLQVEFGGSSGVITDPVSLDLDGTLNINEKDSYDVRYSVQYGRIGGGGTSWIYFRLMLSVDGLTFNQAGRSVLAKLDNANSDIPYQTVISDELEAGWKIRVEVMRGSEGNDSGGLMSDAPVEGTWSPAPSAEIVVSRRVWEQT